MSDPIDLSIFRDKAYLELCLSLVKDAYQDLQAGRIDIAMNELEEIMETFDKTKHSSRSIEKNVVPFKK